MPPVKLAERLESAPVLSQSEQDERCEAMRRAEYENYLEGGIADPETLHIREIFIRGEVDSKGFVALLDEHYGVIRKLK